MTSIKFDCGIIPPDFCEHESLLSSLNGKIHEIASASFVQEEVNLLYNEFCGIVRNEMLHKLPHKRINLKFGLDDKRRWHSRPWWNDSLAAKWNEVCLAERNWLKTNSRVTSRSEMKVGSHKNTTSNAIYQNVCHTL